MRALPADRTTVAGNLPHVTTRQLPVFIPSQVCEAVGKDAGTTPPDVGHGRWSTRTVARRRRQRVDGAADAALKPRWSPPPSSKGIDLKIVVIEQNPPIDTPLRDIATEVGQAYPGSTVLVLSPSYAGTYSTSLRPGDAGGRARTSPRSAATPVAVVAEFRHRVDDARISRGPPFTIVLVLGVAVAAVVDPSSAGPRPNAVGDAGNALRRRRLIARSGIRSNSNDHHSITPDSITNM